MKRFILISGLIIAVSLAAVGCAEEVPQEEPELVSSCVSCHSDEDLLKQTATPVMEEKSEASSGEG
jgi:hypothetical protein